MCKPKVSEEPWRLFIARQLIRITELPGDSILLNTHKCRMILSDLLPSFIASDIEDQANQR